MLSTLSAAASAASSVIDWSTVAGIAIDVLGAVVKAFL